MDFILSKVAAFLIIPSNALIAFVVLGLLLLFVRRPSVLKIAALLVVIAAFSPLGNLLLTPLEQRFPAWNLSSQDPIDGIIVLGGSYDTVSHSYVSTIYLREDTEPMAAVPALAKQYPQAAIIISGGTDPSVPGPSEASIIKDYFVSFGIPASRISIEEKSQTTAENARLTAEMIHPKPGSRWLLVTSAYHVPRAVGAFRTAGFNVIGCPTGWRTHGWHDFWRSAETATENLRRVDVAAHEWLGLVSYRLSGHSGEWFPGPNTGAGAPEGQASAAAALETSRSADGH